MENQQGKRICEGNTGKMEEMLINESFSKDWHRFSQWENLGDEVELLIYLGNCLG